MACFPRLKWVKFHNIFKEIKAHRYRSAVSLLYILAENNNSALIRAHSNRQSCFHVERQRYGPPILAASATKSTEAMRVMLELEIQQLPQASRSALNYLTPLRVDILYTPSPNFTYKKRCDLFPQLVGYGPEQAALIFLLAKRPDVNKCDLRGKTVLGLAAERGFLVLTQRLIEMGANISITNNDIFTPLHHASFRGYTEILELLLRHGANISATGPNKETALYLASYKGHTGVVKLLLCHGADTSTIHPRKTASQVVLSAGHAAVANPLIDRGTEISAALDGGETALHVAVRYGRVEVVKLLISSGAELDQTVLDIALRNGRTEIAGLLLQAGKDRRQCR
ncbi:ankyrin repeat-containing domain protein [Xylaria sp. FL0933]|nr:ankyrin repeat-containing domain protein [Xylaria sp. FL0933]